MYKAALKITQNAGVVTISVFLAATCVVHAGSLTPPGAPASTMKTLAETDPGKPIHQSDLPFTISTPGHYFIVENLTFTTLNANAITIAADDVELDFKGFTVTGPGKTAGATGTAVFGSGAHSHVVVVNGGARGFRSVGVALGTFTDSRIQDITSVSNGVVGITAGSNGIVRNCIVEGTGNGDGAIGIGTGASCLVSGNVVKNTIATGSVLATGINAGADCTVQDNTIVTVTGGISAGNAIGVNGGTGSSIIGNSITGCVSFDISSASGITATITSGTKSGAVTGISQGRSIRRNTIQSVTTVGSGAASGIDLVVSTIATISDNTLISVSSGSGLAYGIKSVSAGFDGVNYTGNHIEGISTSTGSLARGISGNGASHCANNFILGVAGGAVSSADGISVGGGSVVENCQVKNIHGGTGGGRTTGISGGTTVRNNSIQDVSTTGTIAAGIETNTSATVTSNSVLNISATGTNAQARGIDGGQNATVQDNVVTTCTGTGTGSVVNIVGGLGCRIIGNSTDTSNGVSSTSVGIHVFGNNCLVLLNNCGTHTGGSIVFLSTTTGGYAAGNHVRTAVSDLGTNTEAGTNPTANLVY
ncbi:MAG: hypothetical protein ABI600_03935 [Luteolibacter sp.]